MIGSWERFRTIGEPPAEAFLHRNKARLDSTVVVDEIFDAEFDSILVAKNDPKFLRERSFSNGSEHF